MANYCSFIFLLLATCLLTVADAADNETDYLNSVFVRFYIRNGTYKDVNLNETVDLVPLFNESEPVTCYIHGHSENVDGYSTLSVVDGLLNYTNVNTLALDYRKIAGLPYPFSVAKIAALGKVVAKVIDQIVEAGVDRKKIHIIGHSLGAQLAGYIGRNVIASLPRITGLDPAGPLYYAINPHLSASDADFVDIIHTDAGFFGLALATGTVDFFPNRGSRPQPGCTVSGLLKGQDELCSHHRSYLYYVESMKNRHAFVAEKCSNILKFATAQCNSNEKVIMGYDTPTSANGKFYLITNSTEPYGLGIDGAIGNSTTTKYSISNLINSLL
ncbi:pancreatic triacylglycerol lipase-like [Osmia bicornis bicornis]|uniref:pancreatic triacylglycerol lipase-like n=1 Tax=Osmia bicornis bicornis TaxID=1437191 RepID=UPI001EAEBBE1|nr:pancreatic triacylglycerol lipase-like [Osmia bicornis bicornis]